MDYKTYLLISGAIFGLVAVGHILRVMFNWSFAIGGWNAPMSASWIAFFAAAAMCVWAIRLGYKGITFALR